MGKKRLNDDDYEDFEEEGFDSGLSAAKMPVDVRGGKTPLSDYMSVPLHLIDEFQLKDGSDFSRASGSFFEKLVETIKEGGIIEAVTLRPRDGGRYEVLAGETRCLAAKEAGLKAVPAHIINVSDARARKIFSWTNLLRRELTMRDRINGWWQYYISAKEEGALASLRGDTEDDELNEYASGAERIAYRQIMRYVQLHDLPSEWIDLLEPNKETGKPAITIMAGVQVLKLTASQQSDIYPYGSKLNEAKLKELVKLSNGELTDKEGRSFEWTEENISRLVRGENLNSDPTNQALTVESEILLRGLNRMQKKIMNVARGSLRAEDYKRAPEIIKEALELYYKQHN